MSKPKQPARTYSQTHVPRPYTPGKRRFTIYWSWSYPAEANRPLTDLDNRFNSVSELRRYWWPGLEREEFGEKMFLQGIAGGLEFVHLALYSFQQLVGEATGHPVAVFQRVNQTGQRLLLDERVLADTDTLLVFGLDHLITDQEPLPEEIEAVREFLTREGTCLVLGPHHDVGASSDLKVRQMEFEHHGDPLVPRQQRFSKYTRALMKGLGMPVENQHGLRPAMIPGTSQSAPLSKQPDLDTRGWLTGVKSFSFHMHLPHYAITTDDPNAVRVLARQPIDMSKPHPFTQAGNTEFNTFLWMPPSGTRAGDILFADSTTFSTLAGVDESLANFWRNLATK
ncbi:MAG: hypothetical protein ACT4QC_05915 [Planctomycetaceae bacterium]